MKTKPGKRRIPSCLSIGLIFMLVGISVSTHVQHACEAYIYGFLGSPIAETLLGYFENKSDSVVTLYSLEDTSSSERFLEIVEVLQVLGVEVVPPEVCTSCMLEHHSWNEVWMIYGSPLMGIFSEGKLTAITVNTDDYDVLDQAIMIDVKEGAKIFTPCGVYSSSDEGVRSRLEELFLGQERSQRTEVDVLNLTSSIILLALADSVNPCTFAVFTALLFITLHSLGRTKAATTGGFFILAIFIGYYILGLGLLQFLATIPYIDKVLAIIGLAIGSFSILRGLKPKFKSPIPKSFRRFTELSIRRSYVSPIASFLLGLTATFTLLPCSSGPYLVGLGLLSTLREAVQAYLLLSVYNIIFVAPLIGILIAVLASRGLSRRIKAFRSTKLGVMELISGALLVAVCIYLLLS